VLSSFNLSHGDQAGTTLTDSISDQFSSFCLAFSAEDGSFCLFFALENDELGTLSALLGNLLHFNGVGEVVGELQVRDGDVVEDDVELEGAFLEVRANLLRHLLSH